MIEIKAQHGPDALAFIASSKATNEEAYLVQKFARRSIGTNNVDNCSRYCQSPATQGLARTVGYGGDSGHHPRHRERQTGDHGGQQHRRKSPGAGDPCEAGAQAGTVTKLVVCRHPRSRTGRAGRHVPAPPARHRFRVAVRRLASTDSGHRRLGRELSCRPASTAWTTSAPEHQGVHAGVRRGGNRARAQDTLEAWPQMWSPPRTRARRRRVHLWAMGVTQQMRRHAKPAPPFPICC